MNYFYFISYQFAHYFSRTLTVMYTPVFENVLTVITIYGDISISMLLKNLFFNAFIILVLLNPDPLLSSY